MSRIRRERLVPPVAPSEAANDRVREEWGRSLDGLGLLLPSDSLREVKTADNVLVLGAGSYPALTVTRPGSRYLCAADVRMGVPMVISATATRVLVSNARFYSSTANYLVRVSASSIVQFIGCIFEKGPNAPMSAVPADEECYVVVESGGRAVFLGCTFQGTPAAGLVVVNLGGAPLVTNVGILGSNTTGQAHQDVTTIFEVT